MQSKDLQPDDLSGQIQYLVNDLEAERAARLAAEAADAAKSDFLAIIGRELREPVGSLVSMTELLLAGPLNKTQQRCAKTLAQSARSLLGSISEVTDFALLEAGEAEIKTECFDLHALVKDAASVLRAQASAKGLTSSVDMGDSCPRFIVGDEARVRQVLMGLIGASLQSTSEGSIRLHVSMNDAETPLTIRFDVADTGKGLSDEERKNLFFPSANTSRAGGDLGLPIARRLAEAMGGDAGCNSAAGRGSLYWFTFRTVVAEDQVEIPATPVADPAPKDAPAAHRGTLSGHVLVVEDNTVNRMLIAAYLDEFGLSYEMVDSGAAALMCLSVRSYDLVLMDTELPDYDGVRMAQRVRALQSPLSVVPLVGLIAHDTKTDGQHYVAAGINARVLKPIHGRALHAALVPFLAKQNEPVVLAKAS